MLTLFLATAYLSAIYALLTILVRLGKLSSS